MFRKLVKYEWAAMIRTMFPMYAAVIVISLLNALFANVGIGSSSPLFELWDWINYYFGGIAVLLYVAILIGLGVFAFVVIAQRFYKGLLGEEGYLMFTLPVKVWQLVFSKALVSFLIGIVSGAVAVLSIGILGGIEFFQALAMIPSLIKELCIQARAYDKELLVQMVLFGIEVLAALIISGFAFIYHIYFAASLGHLSRNHKAALAVVWYIVINTAVGFFTMCMASGALGLPISISLPEYSYWEIHILGMTFLLGELAKTLIFGIGTHYILKNKLNLE